MARASIVRTGLQKSGRGSKPSWTECSGLFITSIVSKAAVPRMFGIVGGKPFLRRPSHVFGISHNLNGELGFSVFVSKDSKGHILHEKVSVVILPLWKVALFCGV